MNAYSASNAFNASCYEYGVYIERGALERVDLARKVPHLEVHERRHGILLDPRRRLQEQRLVGR